MTPLSSEVLAELKERLAAYEKLNATAVGGDRILMARWSAAKGMLEVSLLRNAPALLAAAERCLELEAEKPKAQATIIDTHIQGLRRVRNEHGAGPTPELDARIAALESLQAENAALRVEVENLKVQSAEVKEIFCGYFGESEWDIYGTPHSAVKGLCKQILDNRDENTALRAENQKLRVLCDDLEWQIASNIHVNRWQKYAAYLETFARGHPQLQTFAEYCGPLPTPPATEET